MPGVRKDGMLASWDGRVRMNIETGERLVTDVDTALGMVLMLVAHRLSDLRDGWCW